MGLSRELISQRGALGRKGTKEAGQSQRGKLRASFGTASWEALNSFNNALKYYLINNKKANVLKRLLPWLSGKGPPAFTL